MHAFIEGDNLDMAFPQPWSDDLAERNLAAMWANYRSLGHSRLVYTNTVSVLEAKALRAALGGDVHVTGILLTATDDTTRERLATREIGSALEWHVEASRERANHLEAESPAWVIRVPTDGRDVADIAREVLDAAGWNREDPAAREVVSPPPSGRADLDPERRGPVAG
jgi:hypothetical protein